ncbi:MAG: ATPase, T2SS/T4P/T4SS family [Candidatus Thorarchaeota archaeon]|nr:ATPase, T2SS/T4P/T4SS family [Candidatus Thorarchaeota archaeon]
MSEMQLITCPDTRCEGCVHRIASHSCELVASEFSETQKLLLIEPNRNLIHLPVQGTPSPTEPPWYGNSWETIYMDSINILFDNLRHLVDAYIVGPYVSLFFQDKTTNRAWHHAVPRTRTSLEYSLVHELAQVSSYSVKPKSTRVKLQQKLQDMSADVMTKIESSLPEINSTTRNTISEIIAHNSTILRFLFPLILDDEVEEIYLDRPGSRVYFDHRRLGRILISWKPKEEDIVRLVTFLRAESNLHLDRRNPSLKTDITIYNVPLRISASLPPLAAEGMHLEIRRARSEPYSILDLIRNGTLSVEAAALLILAINSRMNVTITGGPGVGKTTLMNALDKTTPQIWRKIYIEDAIESRLYEDHHQVRIRVDPVDETGGTFDKSTEIVKSLHRSPDYLILGEIQTAQHSHALFHSIAAGLCSIQTCHSSSAFSLITRWTKNHNIDESSIALMDIIVTLERPRPGESFRYVKEIAEVKRSENRGIIDFKGLNLIYDKQNPVVSDSWSKEGAFHHSANAKGIGNHHVVYDAIVKVLQKKLVDGSNDLSNIGNMLWSNSHPLTSKTSRK